MLPPLPLRLPVLGLVRHGATEWTASGRYQGRTDLPLTAQGVADANALAGRLVGMGAKLVVSSPLQRARETALILASTLALPAPETDPRLAEIAFGAWEGLTQAQIKTKWPDLMRLWKQDPEAVQFPGGETLAHAQARMRAACADWAGQAPNAGRVLLVSHAGWIRLALLADAGLGMRRFRTLNVPTGSVHWVGAAERNKLMAENVNKKEMMKCVFA